MPQGSSREEAAFCELEKAVRRGDIQIGVATVKYNQPGDSFHRRWESSIPGFSILGVVIYSFTVGWVHGVISAICGFLLFGILVRPFVMNRVRRRVLDFALSDESAWMFLWEEDGLSLRSGDKEAMSPEDSWVEFIERTVSVQRRQPSPQRHNDGYVAISGLPHAGEPVRIVLGRESIEGVVTEIWQDGDPGFTVEDETGTVTDVTLSELKAMGAKVMGLANVTIE